MTGWPKRCLLCAHLIYPSSWNFALDWSHAGRGLCHPCWRRERRTNGRHIDYECLNRSRDDLMDDWVVLRSDGLSKRGAAERLGMTMPAFTRALERAAAAGDNRANTTRPRKRLVATSEEKGSVLDEYPHTGVS